MVSCVWPSMKGSEAPEAAWFPLDPFVPLHVSINTRMS